MAAQAEALCRAAADVLRRSNKGEGVRQILYSVQLPASTKPQLQAIVLGAQKDESLIWDVARRSGLMDKMPATHVLPDDRLLLVLLYEALLGSRRVRGNSDIFTFVKNNKADLQRCLADLRKQGGAQKFQEKIRLPRYARVNTLKTKMETVLAHFRGRGWKVEESKGTITAGSSLVVPPKGTIIADPILPDIIVFPAGTSLHADPLVNSGALILQDRSSCLSAIALSPFPPTARVADACAAPGNKTSHIAMLVARARSEHSDAENAGEEVCVLAFERDKHRERMLRTQMAKLGCSGYVRVNGRDFTEAVREAKREDSEGGSKGPLWGVTHVLCDPSCSGSGLVAQYHGQKGGVRTGEEGGMVENEAREGEADKTELAALAAEQTKIVCAALSLPNVRLALIQLCMPTAAGPVEAVVYSTCSIHREENEEVVARVLSSCANSIRQVPVLPDWPHRGLETPGCDGRMCARASHDKDSTNGFFVARFETDKALADPGKMEKEEKRKIRTAETGKAAKKESGARRERSGEEDKGLKREREVDVDAARKQKKKAKHAVHTSEESKPKAAVETHLRAAPARDSEEPRKVKKSNGAGADGGKNAHNAAAAQRREPERHGKGDKRKASSAPVRRHGDSKRVQLEVASEAKKKGAVWMGAIDVD